MTIDLFFQALGENKSARIELAAMDMWKPFRNSVMNNAPQARIIYDKFHIMRHLSKALEFWFPPIGHSVHLD